MKKIVSILLSLLISTSAILVLSGNIYSAKAEEISINRFIESGVKLIRENDAGKDFIPETTEDKISDDTESEILSQNRVTAKSAGPKSVANDREEFSDTAFQTCRLIVKASKTPEKLNSIGMASGFKDWYIVQFKNETAAKTAYEKYSSDREIKIVEPDIVCESLYDVSENDTEDENSSEETEPKTCLDSKGSIYTGLYDTKDYLEDSADLSNEYVVGVVDTGVCLTNKFLTGRIIRTYFNACDDGDENSEKDDYIYHGTKVGSVIADNTLDNVKLAFYRVIDKKGQSSPTMISLGIIAAVNDGVDTLNLSLGVYDRSSLLSDAISMAKEKNIAVIAAAGNNHKHVMTRAFRFPACIDCVITVGSSNVDLFYPSYFSNYGECVDLLAPGENVPVSYEESCYGYDSGTSFSTPYVVSLFLQIKTLYPELSNQEIERRMYSSAHKTDIFSDCELYGYGIIDAIGALGIERSDRPTFNLTPGSYIGTQTISITSDSQYEIYYTLDQSFPSKENGVLYTEPFEIEDDNVFVKAVAYSDNKFRSEVESELYQVYKMGNEEDFEITEDGEIVAYTGSENNLKIPETINGITVKSFAKGVFSESQFCGISMPDTLNTVSEEAFIDNNHMQLFEGKGVKAIEECAFAGCVTLMKADIPEVEIIEGWAFSQCKALSQIEAPKCTRIETESFYECFWLRKAYLPNVLYLGYQSFTYCNMLSDFYAPKLKELGECTITEAPYMMGDGRQFTGDELFKGLDLPNLENLPANFLTYSLYDGFKLHDQSYTSRLELSKVRYVVVLPLCMAVERDMPVIAVLPSTLEHCNEGDTDSELLNHTPKNLLKIYGSRGTYAEQWANENEFEFIEISQETAVITDLPDEFYDYMRYLYADVVGFNRTYQWYGSYSNRNTGGVPIEGANERKFVPKDNEQYPYYYCVITSTDVGYDPIEIRTGASRYMEFSGEIPSADYSALDVIIATVPEDLSIYTDETVAALNDIINGIDRNLDASEQTTVDGYVEAISNAIKALKLKEHMVSFIVDNEYILSYELEYGSEITDIPDDPEKAGYTFTGWSPGIPDTMPNESMTFTAEFELITYYASFMADGEEAGNIPFTVETATIAEPGVPEKAGYAGKWSEYTLSAADINVNAVYTPIEYTAKFIADGETVAEIPFTVESERISAPEVPEKEGFTGEWSEYTLATSDITISAEYTINEYKVSFVADDKTVKSETVEYGSPIEIPDNPHKDGYIFKEWLPKVPETMPAKDMAFYAVFEEVKQPDDNPPEAINPSVDIRNFAYTSTVDYRTTITFTAITKDMPKDVAVVWYIDGQKSGEGEKFTINEARESFTIQVKMVEKSGNVLSASETELVKVKTDIFSRIIAFFRMLFGMLPVIEQ